MGVKGRDIYAKQREDARRLAEEQNKRYKEEQRKKRRAFTKSERLAVYEKCGGHCAYCGCKLEMKEMQIDHVVSVGWSSYGGKDSESAKLIADGKMNEIDNLLPACRQCNFYKGMGNLEHFRSKLKDTLWNTCTDNFQARLAMKYGMLVKHEWDGVFYFERLKGGVK